MDVVTLTSVIVAVVTVLTSVLVPLYLHHRRKIKELGAGEVLNWEALNRSIVAERDALRRRLDEIDDHYIARIKELREDWESQIQATRARIRDLESEVGALRRALRGPVDG
jgi:hypothetical protein